MTEAERLERADERGRADAYYGRSPKPRIWKSNLVPIVEIPESEMSKAEIAAYMEGYWNEPDRKEWY